MGLLNKFGSHAGSLVEATLINAVQVGAGNEVEITEFEITARSGTADSIFMLQKSNNGVAYTEVNRFEMPTGGTAMKTFDTPIRVRAGQWFRVRFAQGTAGTVSAGLTGQTLTTDIVDI